MSYQGFFQNIENDQKIREAFSDREEIRFMSQSNGTVVCSYIVSGPDTFRDKFSLEARGITFSPNGQVISRPLHKFFNVNERPSTMVDAIHWQKVKRVMLKRDGSMIHTVKLSEDGFDFSVKSKKSFTSDVAMQSKAWIRSHDNYVKFCTDIVNQNKTAIFEWTSPASRIVIAYDQDELQLLHVRDNFTGEYLKETELQELCAQYNIPIVESLDIIPEGSDGEAIKKMFEELKDFSSKTEGIEGWVIQFENGDMVKLKTEWYMNLHHAMTFLRERDVAVLVIDETIDDLKAKLASEGVDLSPIVAIERTVVSEIDKLESTIDELFSKTVGKDRKTIAIENKGHPLFKLLMQKVSGYEPDVKQYFIQNILKDLFSLQQVKMVNVL